jgi:type IV pilus assembly protein PilQ
MMKQIKQMNRRVMAEISMDTAGRQANTRRGAGTRLKLLSQPFGALLSVLLMLFSTFSLASSANLKDIGFSALPGGRFEIKLDFDAPPSSPKGYNIEKPARIALDFDGVSSQLKQKKYPLSYDNANSVVVLESAGRTRMIVNLVELVPYQTRIEGNSLIVEVGNAGARDYMKPTRDATELAVTTAVSKTTGNRINNLDFNRGELGEGRLVVDLDNPNADIDVFVEGNNIKISFKGVGVPERFQRRYEVIDFATPVKFVEVKPTLEGVLFSMETTGEYDYLAYQADNQYVVSVKPLTPEEVDERSGEFAFSGEKLSLNFQDIEVRAVLQLIADFTGLNLVASDTVSGRVTLRLQNVPWDQALELVLKTKGLDKRQVGNVLMVAPAAEIAERERIEVENNKQIEELAPLQTEHIRIRYAKAEELNTLFQSGDGENSDSVLSSRGSVMVDQRTNSLLITETAQKLQGLRKIIKLLDVPIRQVMIEARIVIANSDFSEELGIKWGVGAVTSAGNNDVYFGANNTSVLDAYNTNAENANDFLNDPTTIPLNVFPQALNVDLGLEAATGQFAIGFIADDYLLSMELSALASQGHGEVVSQPKVITGDKQTAEIKSGQEIPYQESSGNGETTVSFKEAVLKLKVTPSITPDDRIIMDLEINQDSLGKNVPSGSGGFVPTIDTTALTTQVLVANGETVVLGGVFRTLDIESESKVPYLGDIPYLGRLFRNNIVKKEKVETLIFITPRILADTLVD